MTQILSGHISPDTAYLVEDYPYGFRLRCQMRCWLDYSPKHGYRLAAQTTNPKRGNVWNKPKFSTYAKLGGAMFINDEGHVTWSALTEYASADEAKAWFDTYSHTLDPDRYRTLRSYVFAKLAYKANRKDGDPLSVGLAEARRAFINSMTTTEEK